MINLPRIARNPALRIAGVSFILFGAYLFYARQHFVRDPGSLFYDPERAFDRFYVDVRQAEVEEFLAQSAHINNTKERIANARTIDGPCLCATITTVKRDTPRSYVYNTVASLLVNLTLEERASLKLNLLFADLDPSRHEGFQDSTLAGLVDNVFTYDSLQISEEKKLELQYYLDQGRIKDKSINDYVTALQICLAQSDCPYIAVIEEDAMLADSWLVRTYSSLRKLASEKEDWLDMRLFNQETSIGWSSNRIGGNKEPIISLAIIAGLLACTALLWKVRPASRHYLNAKVLAVLCLFTIPVAVVLFFQSGKASLLPPRPGVRFQFFGCCSQAMVFQRQHVPGLIDFLLEGMASTMAYDMLTRNFAWANKLQRAAQYPVMAQHVGTLSASQNVNSSQVWSMAFEQLDRSSLAQDHIALYEQVWGQTPARAAYYD